MALDDCRQCFFYAGEDNAHVICTCFHERMPLPVLPSALGTLEVVRCPLDIHNL
jgi:hypothetical protein